MTMTGITCGFCSTGAHNLCPSGTKMGNGSVHRCGCGCERSQQFRCLDCNSRDQGEIHQGTWTCIDRNACQANITRTLEANPTVQRIRKIHADIAQRKAEHRAARVERAADVEQPVKPTKRPVSRGTTPRDCTCGCGGQTKGGKFLPGHDSKYLTILAGMDHDQALELARQISPAFEAKIKRRLERAK